MFSKCYKFGKECLANLPKYLLDKTQGAHQLAYELIRKRNDYIAITKRLVIPQISSLPKWGDPSSLKQEKYILYATIKASGRSEQEGETLHNYSKKEWKLFIEELTDEVSITLGYRKAFSESNPFAMYHLILLVTDSVYKVGMFGYNQSSTGKNYINNDFKNNFSNYIFYKELTIHGTKKQVEAFFNLCEQKSSELSYNGIFNNCYSPIISSLRVAKELGFTVPKQYKENILIIPAMEQNRGMGIIYNSQLSTFFKSSVDKIIKKAGYENILTANNFMFAGKAMLACFVLCALYMQLEHKKDEDKSSEVYEEASDPGFCRY